MAVNHQKRYRYHGNIAETQLCSRGITAEYVPAITAAFRPVLSHYCGDRDSTVIPSPCSPLLQAVISVCIDNDFDMFLYLLCSSTITLGSRS